MWARSSHKLMPINKITSNKVKFKLTKIEQDVFDEIKRIFTRNNLLTGPGRNEGFKIHTDARKF